MIDEKRLIEELENLKAKTLIFKSDILFNNAIDTAIDTVKKQPKVNEWIKVEKAYKKVCRQLAEKTIAPKEYWEKWGMKDD